MGLHLCLASGAVERLSCQDPSCSPAWGTPSHVGEVFLAAVKAGAWNERSDPAVPGRAPGAGLVQCLAKQQIHPVPGVSALDGLREQMGPSLR